MGHQYLMPPPLGRRWQDVVALIGHGASAWQVANAALRACEKDLNLAADHAGVIESAWLLFQITAAARSDCYLDQLYQAGLPVSHEPDPFDILAMFTEAVDRKVSPWETRSHVDEVAKISAVSALANVFSNTTADLYPDDAALAQRALADHGAGARLGTLMKTFLGGFMERCISSFLDRCYPQHVSPTGRFTSLAAMSDFKRSLAEHCHHMAGVVDAFAAGWARKTEFERGEIDRGAAREFVYGAMSKLVNAIKGEVGELVR
jgi:hypothetical protein